MEFIWRHQVYEMQYAHLMRTFVFTTLNHFDMNGFSYGHIEWQTHRT